MVVSPEKRLRLLRDPSLSLERFEVTHPQRPAGPVMPPGRAVDQVWEDLGWLIEGASVLCMHDRGGSLSAASGRGGEDGVVQVGGTTAGIQYDVAGLRTVNWKGLLYFCSTCNCQ